MKKVVLQTRFSSTLALSAWLFKQCTSANELEKHLIVLFKRLTLHFKDWNEIAILKVANENQKCCEILKAKDRKNKGLLQRTSE